MKTLTAKRIIIVGTTGCGKTTLAKKLSKQLQIPHFELDALHWGPNWQRVPDEIFRKHVKDIVQKDNWIIDGGYTRIAKDLIWGKVQLAIWLDFPFPVIFYRLMKRTLNNIYARKEYWPGCHESIRRQFLSKDSIFLWAISTYRRKKKTYPILLKEHPNLELIRITHPRELRKLTL